MTVHTQFGTVGLDETGAGDPLLLLHGFPHDRTLWAPQLSAPAPGVRCIAPDLPGFGESAPCADPSLDTWADWVADLLDTLEIKRAIIGGLSLGGYLAFAIWRRHPHRVRALVLADTRAGADSEEGRAKRREMQSLVIAEGPSAISQRMITGMVGKTSRARRPEVVAALDAMMSGATVSGITDALQALIDRDDSVPTLATITVPTLVICGEEDTLTPVSEARAMHEAIRGSQLALVPEAGHVSNIEAPEVFNRLLSSFLATTIRDTTP